MADHSIVTARWPITAFSPESTSKHDDEEQARRGGEPSLSLPAKEK